MSTKRCAGNCNPRGGHADYPHRREPWRCRTFRCSACKRWVPWCNGAADDRPNACDDCVAKRRKPRAA